jgi:hypothetical protein
MTLAVADLTLTHKIDGDVSFTVWKDGKLNVTCGNDWAGDTQTGFGEHCSVVLELDQAKQLLAFLKAHYDGK